jgi:hypothetical protein
VEFESEEPTIKNINYVTSTDYVAPERKERENTTGVAIPASPRSAKQIYSLHSLTETVMGGFETRDMTIGELKKELSKRKQPTNGNYFTFPVFNLKKELKKNFAFDWRSAS